VKLELEKPEEIAIEFLLLMEYIDAVIKHFDPEDREFAQEDVADRATLLRMHMLGVLKNKEQDDG